MPNSASPPGKLNANLYPKVQVIGETRGASLAFVYHSKPPITGLPAAPAPSHSPRRTCLPFSHSKRHFGRPCMKLVRYGAPGREKPGIIDADGKLRDLSRVVKDIDSDMLASGGLAKIKKANVKRLKAVGGKPRLGPCIGKVRNFIA